MKVYEGERTRWGYGFAWRNYDTASSEAFLVPFNLLARWAREFYFWLAKPNRNPYDEGYLNGYAKGREFAEEYCERKIERLNNEWSLTLGKAILAERERAKEPPKAAPKEPKE